MFSLFKCKKAITILSTRYPCFLNLSTDLKSKNEEEQSWLIFFCLDRAARNAAEDPKPWDHSWETFVVQDCWMSSRENSSRFDK